MFFSLYGLHNQGFTVQFEYSSFLYNCVRLYSLSNQGFDV